MSYNLNSSASVTMFVMTVDVEADDAWCRPDRIALNNLSNIPAFQACCDRYGIVPTYLVTYECATRDRAVSVLKPIADVGTCEIGHHLHAWTTPPFERENPPGIDAAWLQAYQSELPDSLFREKAECLRLEIEKNYGMSPTSHRAGRWGIDQRGVDWLIAHGFTAESSVVPLMSWSHSIGRSRRGPSFYNSSLTPFAWKSRSGCRSGEAFLMEIPLTVYFPDQFLPGLCIKYLQARLPGSDRIDRLYRKLIGGTGMLRPDPRYRNGALRTMIYNCIRRKIPVLNCMIHSSELETGTSPFSATEHDCDRVWGLLEEVFRYIDAMGIPCVTLSMAAQILMEKQIHPV